MSFAVAATETFSERNAGASVEAALETPSASSSARGDGLHASVTVSVAFGCPFEGPVDPQRVLAIGERLAATEADEPVLADTIGVATPTQATGLVEGFVRLGKPVGGHFHNTRNTGYANAYAALAAGATALDASVGGLGGCPFAPKATGNVATEDLAYLLEGEGVETGVDLEALIGISEWLEELSAAGSRATCTARACSDHSSDEQQDRGKCGEARNSARNPTSTSFPSFSGESSGSPARSPRGPAHGPCARFRRPGRPRRLAGAAVLSGGKASGLSDSELEDALVLDVFQVGLAEIADGGALRDAVPDQHPRRFGEQDLSAVPAEQMRGADHVHPEVALVADRGLAGVEPIGQ